MNQPTFLVIDLFCGFGGTTLGFSRAEINGQAMVGSQSDHKKFIGNSVEPNVVKAWVEALGGNLQMDLLKLA